MADLKNIDTFVFHGDWLKNISILEDIELQDKIIADMVRYGVGKEPLHSDDSIVSAFVQSHTGLIDSIKGKYALRQEQGEKGGRKKKINDKEIYDLARQGKTAKEIAVLLNCNKSTIDHNTGWRNRYNDDWGKPQEGFVF